MTRHSLKIPIPCDPIISLSGLYHRAMVWYPGCKWQVPGEFKNHSCPGLLQIDWIYSYLTGHSPKQTNEPVHLLKETVRTEYKETWSLLVCNCETLEITWELPVWKRIHFIHTKQQLKREKRVKITRLALSEQIVCILSTVPGMSRLTSITNLWGRYYYLPYFTDEQMEVQRS